MNLAKLPDDDSDDNRPAHPHNEPALPDGERQLVADRLQQAVGLGALTLQEYIERIDVVYASRSRTELATAIDGLPTAPAVGTGNRTKWVVNVVGDETRSGAWRADSVVTAVNVFGDTVLDLRGAYTDTDEVVIKYWGVFGDIDVLVPEGVEVELTGVCLFGDRKIEVAPVPRVPGTPRIRLVAVSLFGDASMRSEPKRPRRRSRLLHGGLRDR
ncbi:DUF1707 SHOCT-like domain-containing protein [Nakamurella lactea]|uniref:DUF1707 SHOCT-like domain-containing protein n=1 Tax=Nakamurella lactea TaxID=459515 RepID=UPI0003FABD38|nr:DUF1707 domain-containing protein [Nakamurella lactea]